REAVVGGEFRRGADVGRLMFVEEDGCRRRTTVAVAFLREESANREVVAEDSDAALRSIDALGDRRCRDRTGGDVCEQVELDRAFERLGELERAERVQDEARVR